MAVLKADRPQARHYQIGNRKYVRVSTVLNVINKPSLSTWRGKVGNQEADRISKESATFGTKLHAAIEAFNRTGEIADQPADLAPHVSAYIDWAVQNVAAVVAPERLCVSEDHGFAGTLDCLVELKTGELAILDYKSSKTGPWDGLKAEYGAQLAAYRLALAEENIIVKRRIILQLPSNEPGRLLVWDYPNHRVDTLAFLNALDLYRWLETW